MSELPILPSRQRQSHEELVLVGLRLDGESVWAIRRMGWMELGFKESYFRQLMDGNGWVLRKEVAADTPCWGTLFIASRKTG